MYDEWPFFRVTIDLIEMVFAKGDPRIAELYDHLLVDQEKLKNLGKDLRRKYNETRALLLQVIVSLLRKAIRWNYWKMLFATQVSVFVSDVDFFFGWWNWIQNAIVVSTSGL